VETSSAALYIYNTQILAQSSASSAARFRLAGQFSFSGLMPETHDEPDKCNKDDANRPLP